MRKRLGLILALWMLALGAQAQNSQHDQKPTEPAPDVRWSDSVVVVVHAPVSVTVHGRCPAMWRLSRGEASVWVLPVLLDAKGDDWDTSCFTHTLKGANALLLNSPYLGVDAQFRYLRPPLRLKDVVSPTSYARYLAAAKRVHADSAQYDRLTPAWAAYPLYGDAYTQHFHHESAPDDMPGMARRRGVHVRYVPLFNGGPRLRNARNALDSAGQEACLNSVLDRLDFTLDNMSDEIRAWKTGDIATVLKLFPPEDDRCTPPGMDANVGTENENRWTQAIMDALDTPGKSIAAIPLNWFLYRGGVLDQVKAADVTVSPPAMLTETAPN